MNKLSRVGVAALATALVWPAAAAAADSTVSSSQLTSVVTQKGDLKAFFKKTKTEVGPTAGTGDDRIGSQGICWTDTGMAVLKKLPKRQAWADYRIGKGETKGSISIVGQYKSEDKARSKFSKVKSFLESCPDTVVDGSTTIEQSYWTLPKMYKGKAVGILTSSENMTEGNILTYVAVRQNGASLSFARYTISYSGDFPEVSQIFGAMDTVSAVMAYRYHAAS